MLIDSTLREGEQCFGVYFTSDEKQKCLVRLGRLGVEEIELGAQGQEDLPELARLAALLAPQAARSVWCRARKQDVLKATELGCRLNVGVPVSENHIRKRLGLEPGEIPAVAANIVAQARNAGCEYVSLGLEDVSRADRNLALQVAAAALQAGASRLRLADSVGVLDPCGMQELVREFRALLEAEGSTAQLAVHCHNDFGMATGNAVAALTSGADYADTSLLGAGERAGIARTEEVAAWLTLQARWRSYRLQELRGLCALVAKAAKLPPTRLHPVVGRDVFAAESGLHVHALHKDPELFEPYDPREVHAERRLGLGKKSGRAAVGAAARSLGLELSTTTLPALVAACREKAAVAGRPLREGELLQLVSGDGEYNKSQTETPAATTI